MNQTRPGFALVVRRAVVTLGTREVRRQLSHRLLVAVLHVRGSIPLGEVAPAAFDLGPGNKLERFTFVVFVSASCFVSDALCKEPEVKNLRCQSADDALVDVDGADLADLLGGESRARVFELGEVDEARRTPVISLAEEDLKMGLVSR